MEAVEKQKHPPPQPAMYAAVMLELCIVTTFVVQHSIVGICFCAAYAWFSATWALIQQSWQ